MFARVTTYELEADRATEAVDAFAPAIENIKALDGLVDAYFLVECGGDRALSMTIWESQDAMERSRVPPPARASRPPERSMSRCSAPTSSRSGSTATAVPCRSRGRSGAADRGAGAR